MHITREKFAWALAGVLALFVVGAIAGVAQGGPLDPPGPPASTGPIQMLEQNLDGDGNIKVHEQGSVDVNIASVGGLPVPRLILLAQDVVIPTGPFQNPTDYPCSTFGNNRPCYTRGQDTAVGTFVNVEGCKRLQQFAIGSNASDSDSISVSFTLGLSPDGSNVYAEIPGGGGNASPIGAPASRSSSTFPWGDNSGSSSLTNTAPYVTTTARTEAFPVDQFAQASPHDVTLSAWLYCS